MLQGKRILLWRDCTILPVYYSKYVLPWSINVTYWSNRINRKSLCCLKWLQMKTWTYPLISFGKGHSSTIQHMQKALGSILVFSESRKRSLGERKKEEARKSLWNHPIGFWRRFTQGVKWPNDLSPGIGPFQDPCPHLWILLEMESLTH